MDETDLSLSVPDDALEALPADGGTVERDMDRAVDRLETRARSAMTAAEAERGSGETLPDLLDDLRDRRERYESFVPELRAWGQSPVYALAWRTLYTALIEQLRAVRDGSTRTADVDEQRGKRTPTDPETGDRAR